MRKKRVIYDPGAWPTRTAHYMRHEIQFLVVIFIPFSARAFEDMFLFASVNPVLSLLKVVYFGDRCFEFFFGK